MKKLAALLCVLGSSLIIVQCEGSKSSSSLYGNLTFANTSSNDATVTTLTKLSTCKRDADVGTFDFEAMDEQGSSAIKLRIKGFKSTMETYSCKQTDDNRTGTSLGSKYDNCFVAVRVSTATGQANAYSMYRDEAEKNQSFIYSGSCQIQVSETSPKVKAKVVCTKMIQTTLNGTTRNPISESVTGDVSAEFDCQI